MSFVTNKLPATGTANGVTAGNRVSGNWLPTGRIKNGSLAAKAVLDAETNTLTMTVVWQGANALDKSDAIDLAYDPQNPAAVVVGTGTAGADASISKAFPCPPAGYGFKYVRMQVSIGVATGAAADTYDISYNYRSN